MHVLPVLSLKHLCMVEVMLASINAKLAPSNPTPFAGLTSPPQWSLLFLGHQLFPSINKLFHLYGGNMFLG
jgi:hypothetical protein